MEVIVGIGVFGVPGGRCLMLARWEWCGPMGESGECGVGGRWAVGRSVAGTRGIREGLFAET